jgi:hypothetical protein
MRLRLLLLAALSTLALTATANAATCASGDASSAARALYGSGTDLVSTSEVAGLQTALALEPRIAPGTRRRMVRAGTTWCDAADGFNAAWAATGKAVGNGRDVAIAYASLAAAPYFDGVSILDASQTAAGAWVVRTHAQTNGVDARWLVATDAAGVRSATWTATAFAQRPFTAEWEGLTALPGATETYDRLAGGLLRERRGLPTAKSAAVADTPGISDYHGPDGMTISISIGDAHVGVDPGVDSGVHRVDIVRDTMRAIQLNYEEFLSWGLKKGWESRTDAVLPDHGFVYINDALSAYCLACVFIADDFQIHFMSEADTALAALGYTYPDPIKAFNDILGHEMFHNFQNAYNNPGPLGQNAGRNTSTAYSEGSARFQETLHSYSDVSHQPKSLFYANDINGCNGYGTGTLDAAMANGPFGHSYDACFFWTPWFAAYGQAALIKLVSEAMPAVSADANSGSEGLAAIAGAAGEPVALQMARFARSALTGQGYAYAPLSGSLGVIDWGPGLERWQARTLDAGSVSSGSLSNGGMMARQLTSASPLTVTGATNAALFVIRATATDSTITELPLAGGTVDAPAAGEKVWAVVVNPTATTARPVLRTS